MIHRRLLIVLMTILIVNIVAPVYAHTTIGNLNGTSPYFRSNDHELNPTNTFGTTHVPGPLGYIWPGSGFNFYTGSDSPPGYQSPFQDYEDPLQLAGNSYSPHGAILTSTSSEDNVGDIILAVNFSHPQSFMTTSNPQPTFNYSGITIYVPAPIVDSQGLLVQDGFEPAGGIKWDQGDSSNVLTTLTSDYGRIFIGKADMNDPFAPGWWVISITPSGEGMVFTPERNWREWYYIRINQLRSPFVAGRYLFKVFLGSHYPVKRQGVPLINSTMPVENWPVLLVKGELDPAIIYGTIRYGTRAAPELHNAPIKLPGMVRAVGSAIDPLTGNPTNRPVEARGYFNATAEGHFEVEGVASGIYDLYASAAGLPERKVAEIKVLRGQSFNIDLYLDPGPEIRGEIFSKSCYGHTPWKGELPISVAIYSSDNYIEDNAVSYSPINLTHAPYTSYVIGNTIFDSAKLVPPNTPKLVAFPWEGPVSYYLYTAAAPYRDPYGVHNGVGPAQIWWISPTGTLDPNTGLGSTSSSFIFQFGAQRYYGTPRLLSGMVPQAFATWIDGLGPGTYFVRAYVNGYIQTDVSGSVFQDYYFTITEDQTLNTQLYLDLWLSGTLNLTVHFHDSIGSMQTQPIGGPDPARVMIVEAIDGSGSLAAFNFTYVPATATSATITLNGLGMAGVIPPPDPRAGIKYSLYRYRGLRDYGIYPGSYLLYTYMRGYIQALGPATGLSELDQPSGFSISTCNRTSFMSTHMFRGAGINVTLYSMDCQNPPSPIPWKWDDVGATLLVYDVSSRSYVDSISFWNAAGNTWSSPCTNSSYSSIPWPGWQEIFGPTSSALVTNGSTILERLGPDLPPLPALYPEQDIPSNAFFQSSIHLGFLFRSEFYRFGYRSILAIYPGRYAITGWTYGYVQEGVSSIDDLGNHIVATGMGQIADTSVRLITGVEFDLKIAFRKELLPSGLPSNMSMRIRIYDDKDILVAAASTSVDIGSILPSSDVGFFADGKKVMNAGGVTPPIPAGTLLVEYKRLAGMISYVDPVDGAEALTRLTLFSADKGVWGDSSWPITGVYKGDWRVLVELVPWYRPSEFYPPTQGLLKGEVHQTSLATLIPYNHLGPYELRQEVIIPNTYLCGRASTSITLDLRSIVTGKVMFDNMHGDLRTVSWATISLKNGEKFDIYSWDGFYEGYLPPGVYILTVKEASMITQNFTITVPDGGTVSLNSYFRPTGIPIPEFPYLKIVNLMIIGITINLLVLMIGKKKRINS